MNDERRRSRSTAKSGGTSSGVGCPARRVRNSITSRFCWAAVRMRLIIPCLGGAPRQVLFPPQTSRFTTAGRIACSARQFVASTPSCVRKVNRASSRRRGALRACGSRRGAERVGEHRDALCEVGHDGLSLLFAEIPASRASMRISRTPARSGSCPGGRSAISSSHRLSAYSDDSVHPVRRFRTRASEAA